MATKREDAGPAGLDSNRLLAAWPEDETARLASSIERVSFELKQTLAQPDQPVDYVLFPTTAMISQLVVMEDGSTVESGIVGGEGLVGLSAALGIDRGLYRPICQVPGEAWRMPVGAIREVLR